MTHLATGGRCGHFSVVVATTITPPPTIAGVGRIVVTLGALRRDVRFRDDSPGGTYPVYVRRFGAGKLTAQFPEP